MLVQAQSHLVFILLWVLNRLLWLPKIGTCLMLKSGDVLVAALFFIEHLTLEYVCILRIIEHEVMS